MNRFFNHVIFIALLGALVPACNTEAETTIKNYNLGKPEKFYMPESLLEISGIAFYKGESDTVYGIQDEQGRLFRLAWGEKKQNNAKFGKQGDYEDVTIMNDQVFILKSNGTIFSFPFADAIYEEVDSVKEWKGLLPKAEYEGIYGDETTGRLYIICKNCPEDNSKDLVSGYIIQAGDSAYQSGTFQVDVNQIKSFTGKVKRGFRPSGLARNPVTGEWFLVSAVNKLLVATDSNWNIKEACFLNGNIFNQPEGIAFDKRGNLYISNEGDDLSQGNILKFVRSK
jgi:hypothetical protein